MLLFNIPVKEKSYPESIPFSDMGFYALAAWHDFYRRMGKTERCIEIQGWVKKLPVLHRIEIKKLNYYQEVKE